MKFHKISDTELHCRITMDEIRERGLDVSDLMEKNQKAWDFFEEVMEEGEDATGFGKEGPMSIEGIFVGSSLELVFRVIDLDSEEMRKLCEAGVIPENYMQPKIEYKPVMPEEMIDDEAVRLEPIAVAFFTLDRLWDFARRVVAENAHISFYKIYDMYVLIYDMDECDHAEVGQLCQLANEYAGRVTYGDAMIVYVLEHGQLITDDFRPF